MKHIVRLLNIAIITALANCFIYIKNTGNIALLLILIFLSSVINIFPSFASIKIPKFRLKVAYDGCELLIIFLVSVIICVIYHIKMAFVCIPQEWSEWLISLLIAVAVEFVLFWNGIIRVYCTSVQLGITKRILGAVLGWIPIANICMLISILNTVLKEVKFETEKVNLNKKRREEEICNTKYPVLLVHGVFFRDSKLLNYWGRVPAELEYNGARIFYGEHESASSIEDSAQQLYYRIKYIVEKTGCEKLNIIAHSKGGLDCRYAISMLGAAPFVASLTTISTPHRGCIFVDNILNSASEKVKNNLANTYNSSARALGDTEPDFMTAVKNLTASACEEFNRNVLDAPEVYYQSVGSKLGKATSGKFPLNVSYPIVKHYSGANDGLVAEPSFRWGSNYQFVTASGKRGISHGDMIDLNRENFEGFDVREFYVQLVADLKNKGF